MCIHLYMKRYNMNDYSDFKKCLKIGQLFDKKAQIIIIEYYKGKYYVVCENNTNEYDFKLSNYSYTR